MLPADQIPFKSPAPADQHPEGVAFLVVGLALHIIQLNMEGLSMAKHLVIHQVAEGITLSDKQSTQLTADYNMCEMKCWHCVDELLKAGNINARYTDACV